MKKLQPLDFSVISSLALGTVIVSVCLITGCLTSKTTTVTPGSTNSLGVVTSPVTNTVTTVNTVNLTLDASVLQAVTATAVSIAIQKDPAAAPILQNVATALGGILNGASTNTTAQVIALLGSNNNNAAIATELGPLINIVSAEEQTLLSKYGLTVSGQITLAIAKAVDSGFIVGLASAQPLPPPPAVK